MLSVNHISVRYPSKNKQSIAALSQVSLEIQTGETLGIVGESGCGKSTLARAILGLQPIQEGRIEWQHQRINTSKAVSSKQNAKLRRDIQLIFQDPLDALNPRMTVGEIVAEPLRYLYPELKVQQRQGKVAEYLQAVGLLPDYQQRYPHEFSGGQCQRIAIARAMIVQPKLLVCDEPVSALDVSIQAQIINLLKDLQAHYQLSMLFISHDLHIIRHVSHRILVLYRGQVMEHAPADVLYQRPRHPYTQVLLAASPLADPRQERLRLQQAAANKQQSVIDSNAVAGEGCVFAGRCVKVDAVCRQRMPELREIEVGHWVACHHYYSA